jgi:hypothetical protein
MKVIPVLLIALVSLSGCAQNATVESSSAFEELTDGSCISDQSQLVQEHISGQINALSNEDWESAYSYASPGFREVIDLDQFTFILGADYQMLINNQGVQYGDCTIRGEEIIQRVSVTSADELFELSYSLSFDGKELGIESASTILSEPQTSI